MSALTTVTKKRRGPARLVLPLPPDDSEKYTYIERNLGYLVTILLVGSSCLAISQLRFELHDWALAPFLLFTGTYIAYQAITLPVNFTGQGLRPGRASGPDRSLAAPPLSPARHLPARLR